MRLPVHFNPHCWGELNGSPGKKMFTLEVEESHNLIGIATEASEKLKAQDSQRFWTDPIICFFFWELEDGPLEYSVFPRDWKVALDHPSRTLTLTQMNDIHRRQGEAGFFKGLKPLKNPYIAACYNPQCYGMIGEIIASEHESLDHPLRYPLAKKDILAARRRYHSAADNIGPLDGLFLEVYSEDHHYRLNVPLDLTLSKFLEWARDECEMEEDCYLLIRFRPVGSVSVKEGDQDNDLTFGQLINSYTTRTINRIPMDDFIDLVQDCDSDVWAMYCAMEEDFKEKQSDDQEDSQEELHEDSQEDSQEDSHVDSQEDTQEGSHEDSQENPHVGSQEDSQKEEHENSREKEDIHREIENTSHEDKEKITP